MIELRESILKIQIGTENLGLYGSQIDSYRPLYFRSWVKTTPDRDTDSAQIGAFQIEI